MNAQLQQSSITRDLVTLAAAVVVIAGMWFLASVIVPTLFAIFLVLAFMPLQRWLMERGLSRLWANVIVIASAIGGMLGIGAVILISIAQLNPETDRYQAQIQMRLDSLASRLADVGINVTGEQLGQLINLAAVLDTVLRFLPSVVTVIGALALALFIFLYGMLDLEGVRRRLIHGLGAGDEQLARLSTMTATVSRYIAIRAMLGGAAAIGDLILLLLVDVEFALLWAFVAFIMSFVPYVGYWVALIPPMLLALAEHGWEAAAIVFVGYWVINGTIDNIIGPKLMGEGLNIAPAVTVVSILFWGAVIGPMGAILAMPLTVAFKMLLLERSPQSRWLALLISEHVTTADTTQPKPAEPEGDVALEPQTP